MRKGDNPAKLGLAAYRPAKLGIAVLSYIPSQEGYFSHSLEILKRQIASIHHSTPGPADLWVFDNGSCAEVQKELIELEHEGWIDFLVAGKHNIGKIGALNWILSALPNDWICYTDSDVLFRPGWLENSIRIMESFPNAGMVAAQPSLFDSLRGEGRAHLLLRDQPGFGIEKAHLKVETIEEYASGVGLPPDRVERLLEAPVDLAVNHSSGDRAVIGASHMQFLIPKHIAQKIVPLPVFRALNKDEDFLFDQKVDKSGFLHLSTMEAYVYHMGNVLDERARCELKERGLLENIELKPVRQGRKDETTPLRILRALIRAPLFKGWLRRLYNFLFELHAQK